MTSHKMQSLRGAKASAQLYWQGTLCLCESWVRIGLDFISLICILLLFFERTSAIADTVFSVFSLYFGIHQKQS